MLAELPEKVGEFLNEHITGFSEHISWSCKNYKFATVFLIFLCFFYSSIQIEPQDTFEGFEHTWMVWRPFRVLTPASDRAN